MLFRSLRAKHIRESDGIKKIHKPLVEMLTSVLKRGAQSGVFRGDADPIQFYITMVGTAYFYLANIYTLSAIFDRDLSSGPAIEERQRHCEEAILAMLKPIDD